MLSDSDQTFEFGNFQLDRGSGLLWRDGAPVHLTAKAYETLCVLVENAGTLVTKETLLERVWPEGFIEPANLTQTIYMLRKTLGDRTHGRTFIDTIPGRGYRFAAPVKVIATASRTQAATKRHRMLSWGWNYAALALVLVLLTLHASSPSGAARVEFSKAAQRDYLLGRHYWSERTQPELNEGLRYFQAALKDSPHYPAAYSGLSDSYSALALYADRTTRKHYLALAEQAAMEGIAIDPNSAEAQCSLAFVLYLTGPSRYKEARDHFAEAIALAPDYATAHEWYSWFLYDERKPDEALAQMAKARDDDPTSPIINYALGYQLYYARRYADAASQWQQTVKLTPYSDTAYYGAGLADEQLGREQRAVAEFRKALSISPRDPDIMAALGHVYAHTQRQRDAVQLQDRIAHMSPTPAYPMAVLAEGLGEHRAALKWLTIAKTRQESVVQTVYMDPRFDDLRRTSKFKVALRYS